MITQKKEKFYKKAKWDWLYDAVSDERYGLTFPQIKPSMLLRETVNSLNGKVPVVFGSRNSVVLRTTKTGTKRFPVPPDAEFDLSELNRPPPEYNFLHDPHLNEYLNNPFVKRRLQEKGLVTDDGFVKCSIKEFNSYRQWIRKLKLDAMEQDWHRQNFVSRKYNNRMSIPNDALMLTKQRHDRAKELYHQKLKKKEIQRRKYLRYMEQKERFIEEMKQNKQMKFEERRKKRKAERAEKLEKYQKREEEVRKIRFRILFNSKEGIRKRKEKINQMHAQKLKKRDEKAEKMWLRKQTNCLEKMGEEKVIEVEKKEDRKRSIDERENCYEKQRRKSHAYMHQQHQENRDNALHHLHEASKFLDRIEEKKEEEVRKWREKLKNIEEREKVLNYYRRRSTSNKRSGSKSKKSVWEIDRNLLQKLINEFSEEEQKELKNQLRRSSSEKFDSPNKNVKNYEPDECCSKSVSRIKLNGENKETICDEAMNKDARNSECNFKIKFSSASRKYDISDNTPSFISFSNIAADDVVEVYSQEKRTSISIADEQCFNSFDDIPGFVIQHTQSNHEHPPCVDDVDEKVENDTKTSQEVYSHEKVATSSPTDSFDNVINRDEQKLSSVLLKEYESHDINDTARSQEKFPQESVTDRSSCAEEDTSHHQVLNIANRESSFEIANTARSLVQSSLKSAAKELGYLSEEMLQHQEFSTVDYKASFKSSINLTTKPTPSQIITKTAKEITELSCLNAALSLGFDSDQIRNVLGVRPSVLNLKDNNSTNGKSMDDIMRHSVYEAALNLGYSDKDAVKAVGRLCSSQSTLVNDLKGAESTVITNARKMSNSATKSENSSSVKFFKTDSSNRNINSPEIDLSTDKSHQISQDPDTVIAHNALRNAAFSLGYSTDEVKSAIGPERFCEEVLLLERLEKRMSERYVNDGETTQCIEADTRAKNSINPQSEYLIRKYSTSPLLNDSIEFSGKVSKDDVTKQQINDSALKIEPEVDYLEENIKTQDDNKDVIYEFAKSLVSTIIKQSTEILRKEHKSRTNDEKHFSKRQLSLFAFKFSLLMLGTASEKLGYEKKSIMKALSNAVSTIKNKNIIDASSKVRFKLNSLKQATQKSLSTSQMHRNKKKSIKYCPLTQISKSLEKLPPSSINKKPSITNDSGQRKIRRLTPFYPASVQQKLIEEFNKFKKLSKTMIIEEEDERQPQKQTKSSVKHKLSTVPDEDYSNLSEAEMLAKVQNQNRKDMMDRKTLSEYPNEYEFIELRSRKNVQQTREKELKVIFGESVIAPSLLNLYDHIEEEILNMSPKQSTKLCNSLSVSQKIAEAETLELNDNGNPGCKFSDKANSFLPDIKSSNILLSGTTDSNKPMKPSISSKSLEMKLPKISAKTLTDHLTPKISESQYSLKTSYPSISSSANLLKSNSVVDKAEGVSVAKTAQEEQEIVLKSPVDFRSNNSLHRGLEQLNRKATTSSINGAKTISPYASKDSIAQIQSLSKIEKLSKQYSSHASLKTRQSRLSKVLTSGTSTTEVVPRYAQGLKRNASKISSNGNQDSDKKSYGLIKSAEGSTVLDRLSSSHQSKMSITKPNRSNGTIQNNLSADSQHQHNKVLTGSAVSPTGSHTQRSDDSIALKGKLRDTMSGNMKFSASNHKEILSNQNTTSKSVKVKSSSELKSKASPDNNSSVKLESGDNMGKNVTVMPKSPTTGKTSNTKVERVIGVSASSNLKSDLSKISWDKSTEKAKGNNSRQFVPPPALSSKSSNSKSVEKDMHGSKRSRSRFKQESSKDLTQNSVQEINSNSSTKRWSRIGMKSTDIDKSKHSLSDTRNRSRERNRKSQEEVLKKNQSSQLQIKERIKSLSNIDKNMEEVISESKTLFAKASSLGVITENEHKNTVEQIDTLCIGDKKDVDIVEENDDPTKDGGWEMVDMNNFKSECLEDSNHDINEPAVVLSQQSSKTVNSAIPSTTNKSVDEKDTTEKLLKNHASRRTINFDSVPDRSNICGQKPISKSMSMTLERTISKATPGNLYSKSEEVKRNPEAAKTINTDQEKDVSLSRVKFVPSPPPGPRQQNRLKSQSMNAILNTRAMRGISLSRSHGSAGGVLSTESRYGRYSSSFRDTMSTTPLQEGDYQTFTEMSKRVSSINEAINKRRASVRTSSVWAPSESVDSTNISTGTFRDSPVQQETPSKVISNSSFTSGHILVTPAPSINFSSSLRNGIRSNNAVQSTMSLVPEKIETESPALEVSTPNQ